MAERDVGLPGRHEARATKPELAFRGKQNLIAFIARRFVRRYGWVELDDATQIAAGAVWRLLQRNPQAGDALATTCATRSLIDELRSRRVNSVGRCPYQRGDRENLVALSSNLVDPRDVYADVDDRAEVTDLASRAMASERLGPRDRRILRLRFFEGLTQRQIAACEGITESRVCQLLGKALVEARTELAA